MKSLSSLALLAAGASAARLSGLSFVEESFPVDVILELPALVTSFEDLDALSAPERRHVVGTSLMAAAQASQSNVVEILKANNVEFEQFWITNTILIKNADQNLIATLLNHDDIEEIRRDDIVAHIDAPVMESYSSEPRNKTNDALNWNLKKINIEEAWSVTKGEGIVVAHIDSGVRYSHSSLFESYRGYDSVKKKYDHNYNWFDGLTYSAYPLDTGGHGTHTMGSIVGSEAFGFGVAPASKWFTSKGCTYTTCPESALTFSAQFVICPTNTAGKKADCTKGANVVNCSWGGDRGNTLFTSLIDAWRKAGIIPVFSAGNNGPTCATTLSPGDLKTVISVGAVAESGALSSFSSRGPGVDDNTFSLQKPDIAAPGEGILSAYYNSDSGTLLASGTSMASPHVAGVVALIMSAFKSKKGRLPTYDEVFNILITTTQTDFVEPSGEVTSCSNLRFDAVPNYFYGWGIIDAAKAVKAAIA